MAAPLTPEQLQAGYDVLARSRAGQGFPTLADALANPLAAALVRMHAVVLLRGVVAYPAHTTHRRPVVCAPVPPLLGDRLHHPVAARDHKRAAAGDRDDD